MSTFLMSRSDRQVITRPPQVSAAVPEYQRADYLVHAVPFVPEKPISSTSETRFHKGFHRRPQKSIGQDDARLRREESRTRIQDERNFRRLATYQEEKALAQFNLFTGEGEGRDAEFKKRGIAVGHAESGKRDTRIKQSPYRFYSDLGGSEKRRELLNTEGLLKSKESAVLGVSRTPKLKLTSAGVRDNFAPDLDVHEIGVAPARRYKNASQIQLG